MIEIKHLTKTFPAPDGSFDALRDINLTVADGDIYGIIGMSGAGKSTLVRCINLLERPTEGQVLIDGTDLAALSPKQLRKARQEITMIFQGFHLLMQRTCLKNVCFPMELAGISRGQAEQRAMELLTLVGLPDKAQAYPAQLSGGQQQRVAIARALATNPKVLLCDEATSALDPNTTHSILQLIQEINRKLGITVVIITHQMSVVEEICNRVAILDNGTVAEEGAVSEVFACPKSQAARQLVFPAAPELVGKSDDSRRIRIIFNGSEAVSTPFISMLARKHQIDVNILSASIRTIENRTYGSMLLSVPSPQQDMGRILRILNYTENITAEEI